MNIPDLNLNDPSLQWERFCKLLWHNDQLGLWLDISRMHLKSNDLIKLENLYAKAFKSLNLLEAGEISNKDEKRMVGHYWLRNPSIAPNLLIKNEINEEILRIENFGDQVLTGSITNQHGKKFTDVLWIGIGGSSLGPILVVKALSTPESKLKFHFLDNIDPNGISSILKKLDDKLETTLVVTVSKSGGTPEPRIAMEQIRNRFHNKSISWSSNAIAITMKDSRLDKLAKKDSWLCRFFLPDWVGGRTSITGAVGLLPAALLGVNIRSFLDGASKMDTLTRDKNLFDNPAALLSASWFLSGNRKGSRDMVVLPYRDQLEVFSRYLQQLIMESLGKKHDREGNIVHQGLAVYGNKGSTDQHAYVQQLRDGLDNFFVVFIEILGQPKDVYSINNENPGDFLSGFLQGTREALFESGRQSITLTLRKFDEISLGSIIALFERSVSLYAELININAYNQPGVEAGKLAANEILRLQKRIEECLCNYQPKTITEISNQLSVKSHEDIYWILRYLVHSSDLYSAEGEWNTPSKLIITKIK